jgi:predicted dehydrogenase
MPPRIRIGFIGAGGWGRQKHLPAIAYVQEHYAQRFDVQVSALCERDHEVAAQVSKEYDIPTVYSELERFAADESLDCYVVVIDPRGLCSVLKTLHQRRVPIFTEKPPGFGLDEARYLSQAIDVPNLVAFNRRYFPIVEQFRRLVAELEEIYYVDCSFYRHERHDSRWFKEGARPNAVPFVLGTGLHAINLLDHLFGEIKKVRSIAVPVGTSGTEAWLCDLDFGSGVRGRLKMLPCSGSALERIEVHSRRRSLYAHYGMYSPIDYPGTIYVHEEGRLATVIEGEPAGSRLVDEGFVGEYLDFFHAVVTGDPTRSNLQNAVNSMRIAEQIERILAPTSG